MKFYQSSLLKQFDNLLCFITTKQDGNIAFHVNDDEQMVLQNHKTLANKHSYSYKKLIHMKQIHSNEVRVISKEDDFFSIPSCDALVTDKKNIPLMVMVADCSALLFYDDTQKVIGVVHAGRTGAFSNIVRNTLQTFSTQFGSSVEDIFVTIAPSICQKCYEVGEEIFIQAQQLQLEYAIHKKGEQYYLDIKTILEEQLLHGGVKKEHIEFSPLCNACNTKEYYSYRKEGQTGRFGGVLMLK